MSKRKSRSSKPSNTIFRHFVINGREEEEEDREEENMQEKNCRSHVKTTKNIHIGITGLPWHFYCRCMFYVPHSVLDISML